MQVLPSRPFLYVYTHMEIHFILDCVQNLFINSLRTCCSIVAFSLTTTHLLDASMPASFGKSNVQLGNHLRAHRWGDRKLCFGSTWSLCAEGSQKGQNLPPRPFLRVILTHLLELQVHILTQRERKSWGNEGRPLQ